MTRATRAAAVARLHGEGLDVLQIAERLGLSRSYVYELLHDPDGEQVRARKASYRGTCVDCGATTHGQDGRLDEPRCVRCGNRKRGEDVKVWTREVLIATIREWAAEYGEPPAVGDWDPAIARRNNDEARALRWLNSDGRWPSAHTTRRAFGSWPAALVAAGFEPRAPHGGGDNALRRRSTIKAAA